MFEIDDSKFGRIKVINVTQARQSIAQLMTDQGFNYVITKNNKPIRVIINYADYKRVREDADSASSLPAGKAPRKKEEPVEEDNAYFQKYKKLYQEPAAKPEPERRSVIVSEAPEKPLRIQTSRSQNPGEPPSIQDLLSELEGESLMGESDEGLTSDDVSRIIDKLSE